MSNMENEIWKPIFGYEGRYEVSNFGRVRSLTNWHGLKKPHIMSQHSTRGYRCINLLLNGRLREMKVHRLVATAFLPNPNNLPQVNHIDGDKTNNAVSNLEWVTPKGNMEHAVRAGLFRASYGHTIIPNEKLHEVIGLRRLGFTYGEIGRMFGISSHAAKSIFDGSRELSRIAGDELNERVSKFVEDNKDKSMFIKGRRLNKNGAPYRCIVQIDKNGNYVRRFDSIKTAAEANGVLHSAIINNLKGRSKFCGGYKYVYE